MIVQNLKKFKLFNKIQSKHSINSSKLMIVQNQVYKMKKSKLSDKIQSKRSTNRMNYKKKK